jgi:hypothetical protein
MAKKVFFKTFPAFFNFIKDIKYELIIVCPYIKLRTLKRILDNLSPQIKVLVVARWNIQDLIAGSSDLEVYSYLKNKGHRLYIHQDIHLKVILKDKLKIILGSANITERGLGFLDKSNIEAVSIDTVDEDDLKKINQILHESIAVNKELYKEIKKIVSDNKEEKELIAKRSVKFIKINKEIYKNKQRNILVKDFPSYFSPKELVEDFNNQRNLEKIKHDLSILDINNFNLPDKLKIKNLEEAFRNSNCHLWQEENLFSNRISFGKYSQLLHNSLMDSPKPYRKNVKILVKNMFNWTSELLSEYTLKKYNHSESLTKN